MSNFPDFLAIFQFNFGDSWDIHGMQPIILGYFFKSYNGNYKYISFQDLHDSKGGHFSDFLAIIQYNFSDSWDIHGMQTIILGYFFPQQLRWK